MDGIEYISLEEAILMAEEARRKSAKLKYERERNTRDYKQILSINSGDSRLVGYAELKPDVVFQNNEASIRREQRIKNKYNRDLLAIKNQQRRNITESKRK